MNIYQMDQQVLLSMQRAIDRHERAGRLDFADLMRLRFQQRRPVIVEPYGGRGKRFRRRSVRKGEGGEMVERVTPALAAQQKTRVKLALRLAKAGARRAPPVHMTPDDLQEAKRREEYLAAKKDRGLPLSHGSQR